MYFHTLSTNSSLRPSGLGQQRIGVFVQHEEGTKEYALGLLESTQKRSSQLLKVVLSHFIELMTKDVRLVIEDSRELARSLLGLLPPQCHDFPAFLRSCCLIQQSVASANCTSIDPKQYQNDSFEPILVKNDLLVRPTFPPQEQTALSMIFVGIDIANCSATREDKRRAGAGQGKTRGGQDPVTEPGHRVQGRGQSVCPGLVSAARGQEKDKSQEEDNSRTREGQEEDKTRLQTPATKFRGAASQCGQLWFLR